ncbi:glycosyltransferase family 31 protein [Bombardia bombarda]|uniref:Glycosyltransferase family 31 protein n=1 Tax=Bombardia bombarda TaxID=252184 RepID=A0AA39X0L0_9PEZI|nr:glycosyltransferase family 31 protein [Bombardia bombarda]
MLSRTSLCVFSFSAIVLVTLLLTWRRLGNSWATFSEPYYHRDAYKSQQTLQGAGSHGGQPMGNKSYSSHPKSPQGHPDIKLNSICNNFPDTSNILLVMKTGASESFEKIPTQLLTLLKCLPDYLIFSDMDQNIAGHPIHDSLSTVLPKVKEGNIDFDIYNNQKACVVDQASCNKMGDSATDAWILDKYKNIHMAERAYAMKPGYDWYLFADADTYVVWPNVAEWLKTLHPSERHFLGSLNLINDVWFAHGGSGYVLSRGMMDDFVGRNPGIANRWDEVAKEECCGDFMFSKAVRETSMKNVSQAWPTINGQKPSTIPYGPSHWCHPIATMHHMNSEDISTFWDFERRCTHRPLLIRDLYLHFFAPLLQPQRTAWDNLSDEIFYLDMDNTTHPAREWDKKLLERAKPRNRLNEYEKTAHRSAEDCAAACRSVSYRECFQWRFRRGQCGFGTAFVLGEPGELVVVSGWDVERIQAWVEYQGECERVLWPEI